MGDVPIEHTDYENNRKELKYLDTGGMTAGRQLLPVLLPEVQDLVGGARGVHHQQKMGRHLNRHSVHLLQKPGLWP